MTDSRLLALATLYRTIYGVHRRVHHRMARPFAPHAPRDSFSVFWEMIASIAGVIATWNDTDKYGPHWYPLALVVLALPPALFGAWLYRKHVQPRRSPL